MRNGGRDDQKGRLELRREVRTQRSRRHRTHQDAVVAVVFAHVGGDLGEDDAVATGVGVADLRTAGRVALRVRGARDVDVGLPPLEGRLRRRVGRRDGRDHELLVAERDVVLHRGRGGRHDGAVEGDDDVVRRGRGGEGGDGEQHDEDGGDRPAETMERIQTVLHGGILQQVESADGVSPT